MPEALPTVAEHDDDIRAIIVDIPNSAHRKPLEALLLVKSGAVRSKQDIVDHFGVTRRTVNRWLKRYDDQGIRGFATRSQRGTGRAQVTATSPANGAANDPVRERIKMAIGRAGLDPENAGELLSSVLQTVESLLSAAPNNGQSDRGDLSNGNGARTSSNGLLRRVSETGPPPYVVLGEVDDLVATIVQARLEREGMRVERALDGIQLVSLVEEVTPDLILIDVRLSGLDGYQIARWIRDHDRLGATPIILLGWPGKETDVVDAFKAGADDYILKPFSPVDLSARVGRLLPQSIPAISRAS